MPSSPTLKSGQYRRTSRTTPARSAKEMYEIRICFSSTRAKASGSEQFVLITKKCLVQNSHSTKFVVPVSTPQLLFYTLNQKI